MFYKFHELGIDTHGRTDGKLKTKCPHCLETRHNKADKSLSVDLTAGLYLCHHCGWSGRIPRMGQSRTSLSPRPVSPAGSSYKKPVAEAGVLTPAQLHYLTEVRRLSLQAIQELGITSAVHFMPQSGQQHPCLCFNYFVDGELVNIKYRATDTKLFAMTTGAELVPYHLDAIRDTPQAIITEGELDAAAFVTAGRSDVVSVPSGANRNLTWMDRFMESHFEQKQVVYIAVDTDAKGTELRDELLRRLGAERCRVVTYGEGCKDANELLIQLGAAALLQALEEAPELPLEGVFGAADVSEAMRALYENGLGKGAETGLENFDALCTFETGRLCVITGHPGDGKSEFTDELVLRLCLHHEWRAAYFSPENQPLPYHLSKLTEKLTGRHFKRGSLAAEQYEASQRYLQENVFSILPETDFSVDTILDRARQLVARRGIRTLVIDPFNCLEHQIPTGQTETQYISSFLDRLSNFARRHRVLVVLVAHPRKMQRDQSTGRLPVPNLQDINGSAAFVNKCDFGLVVERDREAGVTRLHVKKVKFRQLGSIGECAFVYNLVNGRFTPCCETPDAERPQDRVTGVKFDCDTWLGAARTGRLPFGEGE